MGYVDLTDATPFEVECYRSGRRGDYRHMLVVCNQSFGNHALYVRRAYDNPQEAIEDAQKLARERRGAAEATVSVTTGSSLDYIAHPGLPDGFGWEYINGRWVG